MEKKPIKIYDNEHNLWLKQYFKFANFASILILTFKKI